MTVARDVLNYDAKIKALKLEIERGFDKFVSSGERRNLMGRLERMREGHYRNVELDEAMEQLRMSKVNARKILTSSILGGELDSLREGIDKKIRAKGELKVAKFELF